MSTKNTLFGSVSSFKVRRAAFLSIGISFLSGAVGPAFAAEEGKLEEIYVTARKRTETSISVPVTVTALGTADLGRRGLESLDAIAKAVPGLTIQEAGGSAQGGTVSMRGITGPNINVIGDQAVSFNLDGVAIARASVRKLSAFDLEAVEVLKGPQALFYGKNSPGGVVSLRSADPTDSFHAGASLGYEGVGHEIRGEAYVSAPVSDALGVRVAGYYSRVRGWTTNTYPQGLDISPKYTYGPENREWDLRGTLKYNNGGRFTARLKFSMGQSLGTGVYWNAQIIHCAFPGKMSFDSLLPAGSQYDCVANDKVFHPGLGTSFTKYNPIFGKGEYTSSSQQLGGLEMNYDLTDQIKVTSVTGYYKGFSDNVNQYNYPANVLLLPSWGRYRDREISEELRIASDFSSPVNFMFGGLYTSTRTSVEQQTLFGTNPPATNLFGAPAPTEFNEYDFFQHGTAYSIFGQARWKVVPTVELSAGGRWSHEAKSLPLVLVDFTGNPYYGTSSPNTTIKPIKFNNFSPEISASWRPTKDLNIYANYKQGFLSGGYNGTSDVLVPGQKVNSPNYGPEKVKGFEVGVKANLLDDTLRLNASGFMYKAIGLQVASYQQGFSTIRNAGKVDIKGAEGDFKWLPQITHGLEIHGAFAFTRSIYDVYQAPCYGGQTQAMGCTINLYNDPLPQTQNLAGTQVPNAPNWILSTGFDYTTPVGSGLEMGFSGDVTFNTSYVTDSKNTPFSRSPAEALLDASIRLASENDRWQVAFIGRNLSNKFYWSDSQSHFPSGIGTGGPAGTVSVLEDRTAMISRGRELWVKLSVKY